MKAQKDNGQVEKILKELGQKIDELIREAKDTKDNITDEVEEKIEELKVKKNKIEEDFTTYRQKDGRWDGMMDHLEKAWDELKKAAATVFKK